MKILLTAIGKRVQLINHLKELNFVVGVDSSESVPAKYFVDAFYKVPQFVEKEYISSLIQICKDEKIDMLIPLYEKEFLILDEYRDVFQTIGTMLMLSNKNFLEVCNDKWSTYDFFRSFGIDTPKTALMAEIINNSNIEIKFPIIIKPRDGMGSRGIERANDFNELLDLKLTSNDYIVQEFIEGIEFTVDVLCDLDGNAISLVPRQRLEVRDGEVSKSKSLKDSRIINSTLDLINKVNSSVAYKIIGPINIQCIINNNQIKFIEINPRFGGGVPLSFESGVNYGKILSEMLSGKKIEPIIGEFEELTMLRFDQAVFIK